LEVTQLKGTRSELAPCGFAFIYLRVLNPFFFALKARHPEASDELAF
jgi:hypothetical protein